MLHAIRACVCRSVPSVSVPAIAIAIMAMPVSAQPFVDVAVDVGISGYVASTGDGHGPGAVFADLNDDGYPDLYLLRAWGQSNRLFVNALAGRSRR